MLVYRRVDDSCHSLKPTAKTAPENRPKKTPKGNENETYSKHPFSGACKLLVSGEGRCFFPKPQLCMSRTCSWFHQYDQASAKASPGVPSSLWGIEKLNLYFYFFSRFLQGKIWANPQFLWRGKVYPQELWKMISFSIWWYLQLQKTLQ